MKTLIHYQKQRVESFLSRLSSINELYIERSFSFDAQLMEHLKESIEFYEQTGESSKSAKISQLNLYLETAKRGINPQSLEKIKTGRRENIWIASYHVLDTLGSVHQEVFQELESQLTQAKELVEQVILSAIQSKLVDDETLEKLHNQDEVTTLWKTLCEHEQVKLIERKLKLSITDNDIIILCDLVCSKIRS